MPSAPHAAAFTASYLAGYLFLPAPGGIGVREGALLVLLDQLGLATGEVSDWTMKGRHTTRRAILMPLAGGGYVVDTPGIRQFQLWDIIPEEVEGFFPEFRPFVPLCAYADCTHTHEDRCAIKRAVARRQIRDSRYTSYLGMFDGETTD